MSDSKLESVLLSAGNELKSLAYLPMNVEKGRYQYRELAGRIMYLRVCTRHDIAYSIAELALFVADPHEFNYRTLKGDLRYKKGMKRHGLFYSKNCKSHEFYVYVDASWADDLVMRK